MAKPIVAIVGRPNVGKSTIFNKLTGQRLAIVEDTPGVTRDRIFCDCEWCGNKFLLVDTGGIEPRIDDGLLAHMREQAQIAIDSADCIIMVTELTNGVTPQDQDIAGMLMRSGKRWCLPSTSATRSANRRWNSMTFIRWAWEKSFRFPAYTATAPAICWMPSVPIWTSARKTKRMMTVLPWRSSVVPMWASPA